MIKLVGIDPGVTTGLAFVKIFADNSKVWDIQSGNILEAFDFCMFSISGDCPYMAIIEDARLRTWFGQSGPERWQGAGSIKRDCQIWEEWLTHKQIPYILVPPMHNKTKMNAEEFARLTGIAERTNQHERDAAALLLPYNYKLAQATYEAKKKK